LKALKQKHRKGSSVHFPDLRIGFETNINRESMCRSVIESSKEKNQFESQSPEMPRFRRRDSEFMREYAWAAQVTSALSRGDPALVAASRFALHADRTSGARSGRSRVRQFTPPGASSRPLRPAQMRVPPPWLPHRRGNGDER